MEKIGWRLFRVQRRDTITYSREDAPGFALTSPDTLRRDETHAGCD